MPRNRPAVRSGLELVVLALLFERPMHPYRMQKLIGERGNDEVVNVQSRNSIQQTVDRLDRDGLIAVSGTEREGNYPARTVYDLTDAGREHLLTTLREMLAAPAREFPTFPAALSFIAILPPTTAAELLRRRRTRLAEMVERKTEATKEAAGKLPPILLIENDYAIAVRAAEISWLDSTIAALDSGELSWDPRTLIDQAPFYE